MIRSHIQKITLLLVFASVALFANDGTIKHLTSSNYLSTLITSKKPVVVKFWAPWCRPCRKMTPEYEKAARTLKDKVVFAELNVDRYKDVSNIYGIHRIPTLIIFKDNKIIKKISGGMKQKNIEAFVKSSF